MTWAGKQSEQPRSFLSPETYLLLTFPFIERASRRYGICPKPMSDYATSFKWASLQVLGVPIPFIILIGLFSHF